MNKPDTNSNPIGRPAMQEAEKRKPITIKLPDDIRAFLRRQEISQSATIENALRECYGNELNEETQ